MVQTFYLCVNSIDHTFIGCQFTKAFIQEVLQWLNVNNSSNFILNAEDVACSLHQTR